MANCSSCTSNSTSSEPSYGTITDFEEKFAAMVTIIIILAAVFGNGLVFWAFAKFRKLRNPTNFFIINLASMDFLIGLLPATFWVTFLLAHWPGREHVLAYKLWECLDTVCGLGSIWSLAFIAIDRYICIKDALRYYALVTRNRVLVCIAVVWVHGVLTGVLSFLKYEILSPKNWFRYYVFIVDFSIPLAIMAFCYGNIFYETLRHNKKMREIQNLGAFVDDAKEDRTSVSDVKLNRITQNKGEEDAQNAKHEAQKSFENPSFEANETELNSYAGVKNNKQLPNSPAKQLWKIEIESCPGEDNRYKSSRKFYPNSNNRLDLSRDSISIGWGQSAPKSNTVISQLPLPHSKGYPKNTEHTKKLQRKKADLKAARTLSFIMGIFLLTWTPFIMTLMMAAWNPTVLTVRWVYIVKCLHYSNSGLNPFLYTVLNRSFRQAFAAVLCRRKM